MNEIWDRIGISTSILCVLHCLLTPLLVIFLPLAGSVLTEGWFHFAIVIVAVPVAFIALWRGYRRHHQSPVLWWGSIGVAAMSLALAINRHNSTLESALMIIAGTSLSYAHFLNLRAIRRCRG